MKRVRKGFTLVELLIVIAIIGVLGAMMTLSGTNATVAARAASIANGYKVVATAYNLWRVVSGDAATPDNFKSNIGKYLGSSVKNLENFSITSRDKDEKGSTAHVYLDYNFASDLKALANFDSYKTEMGINATSDDKKTLRMKIY